MEAGSAGWSMLVLFAIGCTGASTPAAVTDRHWVARELAARAGASMRPIGDEAPADDSGFSLPPTVSLADGLSEDEAVSVALWNSPRFSADLAQLGYSRADLVAARQLPNPMLSLLFLAGPKQLEWTFSQSLAAFWLRPARVAAARLDAERVAENLVQHGLALVMAARSVHAEWVHGEEAVALSEEQASLLAEIAAIYEARLSAGDINGLELDAACIVARQAQEAALRSRRDAEIARNRMLMTLGAGDPAVALASVRPEAHPIRVDPVGEPDRLVAAALAARPDLRAAELAVEAAGERAGLARREIFQLIGVVDANAEGRQGFEAGPGIQLEIPLLAQNRSGRLRAKAELERALGEYAAKRLEIVFEVRQAAAVHRVAAESLAFWSTEIVPARAEAVGAAESAYRAGDASYLAVLEKRRQLVEARLGEASALVDMRLSVGRLNLAVGANLGS